jgi:lipid-binding SYLF domain-containing protein
MNAIRTLTLSVGLAACLAGPSVARADATVKEAESAVTVFKKADPGLARFFDGSAGYAVFPSIGKGGLVIGGAGGSGIVFEKGKAVGTTSLSQVTIGAQVGGQAYYEIIFFETAGSLAAFKKGEWTMAAQVSAVVLASGASADAKYEEGVAVFTLSRGGAMAEASVGGQKFTFAKLN